MYYYYIYICLKLKSEKLQLKAMRQCRAIVRQEIALPSLVIIIIISVAIISVAITAIFIHVKNLIAKKVSLKAMR